MLVCARFYDPMAGTRRSRELERQKDEDRTRDENRPEQYCHGRRARLFIFVRRLWRLPSLVMLRLSRWWRLDFRSWKLAGESFPVPR
jgi:hypothetical protein